MSMLFAVCAITYTILLISYSQVSHTANCIIKWILTSWAKTTNIQTYHLHKSTAGSRTYVLANCTICTGQLHHLHPVCLLILIITFYSFTNSTIKMQLQQCAIYNSSQLHLLNPIIQYFPIHIRYMLYAVYNTSVRSDFSNQYYNCIISFCFYCWGQPDSG